MDSRTRLSIHARGIVQGVGFRPFVYQMATRFQLTGWVRNIGEGVEIVVQGTRIDDFLSALHHDAPAPTKKLSFTLQPLSLVTNETTFDIRPSLSAALNTALPADTPPCRACLAELFDPTSRYYRYPFINCSHCGPRFTVTHTLPYDRENTVMAKFKLCADCQASYDNPLDRRFHAQATACAQCGPRLSHPISDILATLRAGKIVALKGIGGFHLLCDAHNHAAVARLRQRKQRDEKPFAILVPNVASAALWVDCNRDEEHLLASAARPIVLLPKKDNASLSPMIAPRLNTLGVMLPYAPLHYVLFHEQDIGIDALEIAMPTAFVITSANAPGEPLVIDNDAARDKLASLADLIVDHDRDIVMRCDDSVVRSIDCQPRLLRRARGYVPEAIALPYEIPPTLALGGHMKNTFCLTRGAEAFLSPHLGNIDNRASVTAMTQTLTHMQRLLNIKPARIAHDAHPDFYTSRLAQTQGLPCYAIQHHHAHLAAVAAEHGLTSPALGLALDGFGLGDDHTGWGGELLLFDAKRYQRLGHLTPLAMPGGDIASKQPWRMAAAFLHRVKQTPMIFQRYGDHSAVSRLMLQLDKQINCPTTSSTGRLFDIASSLLNVQHDTHFDGQAAMYLESLVTHCKTIPNTWHIENNLLDMTPLLIHLLDCDAQNGANRFHGTLIAALSEWVLTNSQRLSIHHVVLSGGCFANRILTSGLDKTLQNHGIRTYLANLAPCNDGGLSLGQAWVAGNASLANHIIEH